MPHAHLLIVLKNEDKPKTAELIDRIVKAEIPDINLNPRLYAIVTKNMIHGPCGSHNPKCSCMDKNECKKKYPKSFSNKTNPNCNGYPLYRRRDKTKIQIGKYFIFNKKY